MRSLLPAITLFIASCSATPVRDAHEDTILNGTLNVRSYALGGHALNHGPVVDLDSPVLIAGKSDPATYVALLVYPADEELVKNLHGKAVRLKCKLAAPKEIEHMHQVIFCPSTGLVAP
jgi:hypothetical protein